MPRTSSVRHLSSHGATAFNLQTPLTTDKCSTPEVNAREGSAVALLAYQIPRLDDRAQSAVCSRLTSVPMDRHTEQAPKEQIDRLGGCLSLTVRNIVCPDSFAGTGARKGLTEAARSLHPLSSTRWSLLAFHVKALASSA